MNFKNIQNIKSTKIGKCTSYDFARLGRRVGVVGFVAAMAAVGFLWSAEMAKAA